MAQNLPDGGAAFRAYAKAECEAAYEEMLAASRWEAEAIRRGWFIPREAVRYEDIRQVPPRDPSVVTFKDWLDAR